MRNISEVTKTAFRDIWRNKTRSALTMLGIIIGVAAVILLVSLGQGLQKYITGQFEELGTNLVYVLPGKVGLGGGDSGGFAGGAPNFAGSKLTLEQVGDLKKISSSIDDVGAGNEIPMSINYRGKSKYASVAGVTANYGKIRNISVETGRDITQADVDSSRKIVLLGKGITKTLFGQSTAIGKEVSIGEDKFTVVGILKAMGSGGLGFNVDDFVAIPITAAQRLSNSDSVQSIILKAKTKEDVQDVINKTKTYYQKRLKDDEYSVIDQSNLVSSINQILGVLTTALGGIAAISLVVGGVGIMNIMLVSVTERTREIGLRKAIGARPKDIRTQFLIEAVILSALGGSIGILIGSGGALALKSVFPTDVTLWSVLLAFGVSAGVGIIFGVAPAIRASRLDPIEALRYE